MALQRGLAGLCGLSPSDQEWGMTVFSLSENSVVVISPLVLLMQFPDHSPHP